MNVELCYEVCKPLVDTSSDQDPVSAASLILGLSGVIYCIALCAFASKLKNRAESFQSFSQSLENEYDSKSNEETNALISKRKTKVIPDPTDLDIVKMISVITGICMFILFTNGFNYSRDHIDKTIRSECDLMFGGWQFFHR